MPPNLRLQQLLRPRGNSRRPRLKTHCWNRQFTREEDRPQRSFRKELLIIPRLFYRTLLQRRGPRFPRLHLCSLLRPLLLSFPEVRPSDLPRRCRRFLPPLPGATGGFMLRWVDCWLWDAWRPRLLSCQGGQEPAQMPISLHFLRRHRQIPAHPRLLKRLPIPRRMTCR